MSFGDTTTMELHDSSHKPFVGYVTTNPSPAEVRFTYQELCKKLDDRLVCVGRWPAGDPVRRALVGPDLFEESYTLLSRLLSSALAEFIPDDDEGRHKLLRDVLAKIRSKLAGLAADDPRRRWGLQLSVVVIRKLVYVEARESDDDHDWMDRIRRNPSRSDDDDDNEYERTSIDMFNNDGGMVMMVPTSREARVAALKRVKVGPGRGLTCTVCLGRLVRSARKLPCRHLFHLTCIRRWLETSHYCPVCRHQLPTQES
ncbi:hypothetical protein Tsubulata_026024 [Turnera subulata]|uniref:RING-type E3 ubiquitin transferase n=1 Tax=Turnera subulata TaxID=218843 RepID=A0A9Q0JG05_9ROSI|nr:hypothetical protein Tsubulata_026024 [Turnera subulata]